MLHYLYQYRSSPRQQIYGLDTTTWHITQPTSRQTAYRHKPVFRGSVSPSIKFLQKASEQESLIVLPSKHVIKKLSIRTLPFFVLTVIGLIRLANAFLMGLMPQDAYYYFYTLHPDLSYYDHPPAIALIILAMTSLLGKHVYALKLGDFVITSMMLMVTFSLARKVIGNHRACLAIQLFTSSVLATILTSVSTPDVPLMFFWSICLWFFHRSITHLNLLDWIWTGFFMGLAFDSKYTAIFLLVGCLIFILGSPRHRPLLMSREFFIMLLTFLLTILPVLLWNAKHDWVSLGFQSTTRLKSLLDLNVRPHLTLGVIGHQMFVLLPVLLICLYLILGKHILKVIRGFLPGESLLFLLSFSLPILCAFLLLSPFYWVKLNWMMPGYIAGTILVGIYIKTKWVDRQLYISFAVHLLLFIQVLFYPINIKSDDTWWGWEQLASEVGALKQKYPHDFIFSADSYKTSAILSFYLETEEIYAGNVIGLRGLQFELVHPDFRRLHGSNGLFIDSNRNLQFNRKSQLDLIDHLRLYFKSVEVLPAIDIARTNGSILRQFKVYRCKGYQAIK